MKSVHIVLTGAMILTCACTRPQGAGTGVGSTVSVVGSTTLPVAPDRVSFSVGVTSQDPNVSRAFAANAAKVNAVIAALKNHGVTEQQMQTSYLDVSRVPARPKAPGGFRVSNRVTVTREDVSGVGELIEATIGAGANDVGNLRFFLASRKSLQDHGLELAFQDARSRAEKLASMSKRSLGTVRSVFDHPVQEHDELRDNLRSLGYVGGASIQAGVEEVHFAVSVVFELE